MQKKSHIPTDVTLTCCLADNKGRFSHFSNYHLSCALMPTLTPLTP